MPYPLVKTKWMIWFDLASWMTSRILLRSISVILFYRKSFICLDCRRSSYQNPEEDLTKTQESNSNQKESPEVNNRWSNKLSCSLGDLWVFFSYCSTGISSFPFKMMNPVKTWTAVLYLFLKNKCFIKIFA